MALSPSGPGAGYFVSFTLVDTGGDTSIKRYRLTSADFAGATADAAAILIALQGMTKCTVQAYTLGVNYEEDALSLPVDADTGVRARITYQLAGKATKATEDIPAPVDAIWQTPAGPGFNQLNLLNPLVVDYVDTYQSGGQAFISDGDNTLNALKGVRTVR